MSKQRVFGQQVKIEFSFDGKTYNELCAVDNFNAEDTDIILQNYSLGVSGIESIDVLDDGGNLSFEAKKTDSKLINYFATQKKQIRAEKDFFNNDIIGKRGKNPYINVVRTVTFTDGSVEEVTYQKCVLYNISESSNGNNEEVNEKFTAKYIRKEVTTVNKGEALITGTDGYISLITALQNSPPSESSIENTL